MYGAILEDGSFIIFGDCSIVFLGQDSVRGIETPDFDTEDIEEVNFQLISYDLPKATQLIMIASLNVEYATEIEDD